MQQSEFEISTSWLDEGLKYENICELVGSIFSFESFCDSFAGVMHQTNPSLWLSCIQRQRDALEIE